MGVGAGGMAKSGNRPGAAKKPGDARKSLLSLKGRPEWKEWVDRVAAAERTSAAELIDRALAWYARERVNFPEPPPRR